MRHMNRGGPLVVQESCPFKRTLAATDDQTSLPLEGVKAHHITGMGKRPWMDHLREFSRYVLEIFKAQRQQYMARRDSLAIREHGFECMGDIMYNY